MLYSDGEKSIIDAARGFHGRLVKIYGQLAIRLDEDSYLMTKENILLSNVQAGDIDSYDINSGDLGALFRRMPEINAFVFICSEDSVKQSASGNPVPVVLDDCASRVGPAIPVISDVSAPTMLKVFKDHGGCLAKGSGILAAANSLNKAIETALILEKNCEALSYGEMLGGAKPLDAATARARRDDHMNSYRYNNDEPYVNYIGFDEDEFNKRNELIEYGKKLCKADLVQGRMGNISMRLNDEEMLISPSCMNYFKIKIEDIVKVRLDTLEYGDQRVPSMESHIHARIYKAFPNINAIIITHSNACSVFAACQAGFVIGSPELQQLIGNLLVVPYAPSGTEELADNVVETLRETNSAIISNHGAIFCGPGLELVLAIASAVEDKAANLLGIGHSKDSDAEA